MAEWKHTIKGFAEIFDSTDNYTEISDKLAKLLERINHKLEDDELADIIEDFVIYDEDDGADYFETIMGNLYDWADRERVWIEPRQVMVNGE